MTIRNLEHAFAPSSVAVFGASPRPGALGETIMRNLSDAGFAGDLLPVNPKYEQIGERRCYGDVSQLPHAPQLAIIATPAAVVPQIVAGLGERGTRAAVVLTAGLDDGNGLRQAMLDAARPYLFRVIGPNCFGLFVPSLGLNASFSHIAPAPGRLALLSQSGALIAAMLDSAASRGIGFSKIVSLGDMADVDVGDCLDLLAGDRETRAILMYLETVTNAQKFMSAARAAARVKPVIVVKSGRGEQAAAAAATHTGALGGADRAVDAAFRRSGLLRVDSLEELFDAAEVLTHYRPVGGDRLAILTNGGGAGVLAVDALEASGGTLAELSPETITVLNAALPATWSHGNPVDIIGDAPAKRWRAAADAILADDHVDAMLALACPTALASADDAAAAVVASVAAHRAAVPRAKPVLSVWLGDATVRKARARLREGGIASLTDPADGVTSFSYLTRWSRAQEALRRTPPSLPEGEKPDAEAARALLRQAAADDRDMLTEPEAKDFLAAFGVPVVPTEIAASPQEAGAVAARLLERHDAAVVKLLSRDISHKSDVGGVALALKTPDAAEQAAAQMTERTRHIHPQARIDGFTVQPMIRMSDAHELILGVDDDPVFGPIIVFGAGGTSVEVVADSSVALPPLDALLARELISRTRIAKLLAGYRDRPAADLDALIAVIVRFSRLVVECPAVRSLDINPLIASPEGILALDARVLIEPRRLDVPAPNPALAIKAYPSQWERRVTTRGGLDVLMRPIRPEDETLYPAFLERISELDVRMRFFAPRKAFDHDMLARLTQIDYARSMAFVALDPEDGSLLGVSRFHADPDGVAGEFAVLVRSDLKGRGLGWALMSHLIDYARAYGLQTMFGDVLEENEGMLALTRELGFSVQRNPEMPDQYEVRLDLAAIDGGDGQSRTHSG